MTGMRFQLKGIDTVLRKLQGDNYKKPVSDTIRKITLAYHSLVVTSTPVDTTRLRSSISFNVEAKTGKVWSNVKYAPFVEYGTRFMEARHVKRGSSVRVLGQGMFAYAMGQLNEKMGQFMKGLKEGIQARFD